MKVSAKWKLAPSESKRWSQTKYREVDTLWTGRELVKDTMDITFRSWNESDQVEQLEVHFERSDENELRCILRTIQDYLDNKES